MFLALYNIILLVFGNLIFKLIQLKFKYRFVSNFILLLKVNNVLQA